MVFTKDTTFLNLVRGERDHENYGITHTIKHDLVDEKEKKLLLECYKFECRSCGNDKLKRNRIKYVNSKRLQYTRVRYLFYIRS